MFILNFISVLLLQVISPLNDLENFIRQFEEQDKMKQTTVAVSIKSCRTGQSILEHNSQKALPTASTLKLITTATVLESLGANFQFKNTISFDGFIENSVLNGNVYFKGSGDPTFASDRFEKKLETILQEIKSSIQQLGIQTINGDIIIVDSSFSLYDIPDTWAWNDMGNYYGAIPSDVNFNENKFSVYFNTTTLGTPATMAKISPLDDDWVFINQVIAAPKGTGDNVYFYSSPLGSTILMKGTLPINSTNFEVKGSIPNPPQSFGKLLKKVFIEHGISVRGNAKVQNYMPPTTTKLVEFLSPNLKKIAKECNFYSINLYADAFLRLIGKSNNESPTFENGSKFMKTFWQNKGIDMTNFNAKDGSGLSPQATVPPHLMTTILAEASKNTAFQDFYETIPVVGQNGTVANTAKNTKAAGNIRAKSGSIEGTRAFSGYFKAKNGDLLTFMVVVNHFNDAQKVEVRKFLSTILEKMVEL
jgi:serine-type D-Ala-D-Ala carboxypeptidase/endopeptidase (penicillin-binding protein 4)